MSLRLCTSSLVSYLPLSTILEHFFFNLSKLRLFLYSNSSHLCHHSPCLQWGWLSRSFFCTLALALILPENKILKKFRNYLRPTSDAIYTLKETSSDLGLKRWNEPTVPSEKMVLDLAKSVKEWLRYWRFKTVDGFIHLQKFPFTESEDLPGSGSGGPVEDGLGTSTSGPGSHLPMPAWKFLI